MSTTVTYSKPWDTYVISAAWGSYRPKTEKTNVTDWSLIVRRAFVVATFPAIFVAQVVANLFMSTIGNLIKEFNAYQDAQSAADQIKRIRSANKKDLLLTLVFMPILSAIAVLSARVLLKNKK